MQKILLSDIYQNAFASLVILILLLVGYFIFVILTTHNLENHRQRRRYRIRYFYVASLIFLILMTKIWVQGFAQLLAVLGLVSAALVITNKETIMNFTGWLIINWRELFTEGDLIQIQDNKGYVSSIGLFYFKLYEASSVVDNYVSGRVIKIPNGLIANNPLINLSQTTHLLEQHIVIIISQRVALD